MDKLLLKFIKLYSDPHTLVLVLNTSASQEVCLAVVGAVLLHNGCIAACCIHVEVLYRRAAVGGRRALTTERHQ